MNNGHKTEMRVAVSDDLCLDLRSQSTRQVWLTFSQRVGSSPLAPLSDGYYSAEVLSRCYDTNNNIVDFLSVSFSDNRCSLRVNITLSSGAQYVFVMAPIYPGTGWATVSCNALNGSACVSWTIVPTPTGSAGNNATVANLYSIGRAGKQVLIGSYYNTTGSTSKIRKRARLAQATRS